MNYPADYECEGQLSIFDYISKPYKITKPIRLIELFAGVGSQAMALKAIGAQAAVSNTQLYKQAGNSIVKNVMCEVFKQLIESEG